MVGRLLYVLSVIAFLLSAFVAGLDFIEKQPVGLNAIYFSISSVVLGIHALYLNHAEEREESTREG